MFSLYQAFCFSLLGGMYIVADSLWIGSFTFALYGYVYDENDSITDFVVYTRKGLVHLKSLRLGTGYAWTYKRYIN